MSVSRENLYKAAMSLDSKERADLIAMLLASLQDETDGGVESAWLDEIERRLASLDSGETLSVAWSEARSRIFSRGGG